MNAIVPVDPAEPSATTGRSSMPAFLERVNAVMGQIYFSLEQAPHGG